MRRKKKKKKRCFVAVDAACVRVSRMFVHEMQHPLKTHSREKRDSEAVKTVKTVRQ